MPLDVTPDDAIADADLPPLPTPPARVYIAGVEGRAQAPARPPGAPRLPGSKYTTLRYLLNALLAEGESVVRGPALSDDTAALVRAIRALGAEARWERGATAEGDERWDVRVRGVGGRLRVPPGGALNVGNAGAVLRLLLGLGATLPTVRFETSHPDSLGRRPNADLLDALRSLGVEAQAREPGGLLPITLRGGEALRGGAVTVSGARSSQYLSALLYLAPLLPAGLEITVVEGLRSQPLVRATLRALALAGIQVETAPDLLWYRVPGGQTFAARVYDTPADTPSAAALVAAALALDAPLTLRDLPSEDDDLRALHIALDRMGVDLSMRPDVANGGTLMLRNPLGANQTAYARRRPGWHSFSRRIDGDPVIDSVPVLVALACLQRGATQFANVATLRLKESDRIGDLCAELTRAGAAVTPGADTITVDGRWTENAHGDLKSSEALIAGGATVSAHDDHRLAQALAILATRTRAGLSITGADAVAKSYPWFYDDLRRLGARVEDTPTARDTPA